MTNTMIPKDLLPIIGQYVRPTTVMSINIGYCKMYELFFADDETDLLKQICNNTEVIQKICKTLSVCLDLNDKLSSTSRYEKWKSVNTNVYSDEWCWDLTKHNLNLQPLIPNVLKKLLVVSSYVVIKHERINC